MPTILLLDGVGGRYALHRYQSFLSEGARATAALLSAQTAPTCWLGTQGTTPLLKGKVAAETGKVKLPAAARVLPKAQNANPGNALVRGGKAAGAVPLSGEVKAINRAVKSATHRRAMAMPTLLTGCDAASQPTVAKAAVKWSGTAAESALECALLGVTRTLPSIAEKATTAQCGSRGAAFGGTFGSMVGKNAAECKETAVVTVYQTVDGNGALPLQKTDSAEIGAVDGITVLTLAGLSLVPDWEYPVQQGDTLTVTQVYSAAQLGDTLEVT